MREKLQAVIDNPPAVHRPETELLRDLQPGETAIPGFDVGTEQACYTVDPAVAWFLTDHVPPNTRTLETGSGISTFAFLLSGAEHTAVTPNREEEQGIRDRAGELGIDVSRFTFIAEASEDYLPRCDVTGLGAVLLDGKHAFPWPMVDFFYTADRIERGGLLLVDDIDMRSVAVLAEFLDAEHGRWERIETLGHTAIYRKLVEQALDVAWHMQSWTVAEYGAPQRRGLVDRVKGRVRG